MTSFWAMESRVMMLPTFNDATDSLRIPNQRRRLDDFACLVKNDLATIILLQGFDVVINGCLY